jgi:hypothetical protein
MKPTFRLLLASAALATALLPGARALPEAETIAGRLLVRRFADSIVTVKLTVIMKVSVNSGAMPPNQTNVETSGTMVTPEGVTVVSMSTVDPKMIFGTMRSQMGQNMSVYLDGTETKALRIRLVDGTEIPAKILGQDPARDIVLIGPAQPAARPFAFVDLRQSPESASVLGDCFHLVRLSDAMQRTPVVRPGVIAGIMERPSRRFLVSTDIFADGLGCPVFDAQGLVLGICLRHLVDDLPKGLVVVPSAEVALLVADQVGNHGIGAIAPGGAP